MSATWDDDRPKPDLRIGPGARVLATLRAIGIVLVLVLAVIVVGIVRLIERAGGPLFRPVSPGLNRLTLRTALLITGVRLKQRGRPMRGGGALVSNHVSWLDILVLNSLMRVTFVAKDEVSRWPGVGIVVRLAGTVFIKRDRREARAQIDLFLGHLQSGHKLMFFPEGTSTDGQRVVPFKTTLFAAYFDDSLRDVMKVQPVTILYHAPEGHDPRFYGWWGDMDLGPHLMAVLGTMPQGTAEVVFHESVRVADFKDRKALAAHCEAAVRGPVEAALAD